MWTPTLPETSSSPLKMDGWNNTFLLGRPIFRGYVSFREGRLFIRFQGPDCDRMFNDFDVHSPISSARSCSL